MLRDQVRKCVGIIGRANVVIDALRRKERVKPRRVRAMAMTIQYGVRGMILAAQNEAFKQENYGMMRTVVMDEAHASRFRWMIYLVVLADAAESVSDAIRFEYCLASSSGWTKSPVIWAEIGGSSLIGPELVQETTNKVVLVKEKPKAAGDRQKSYADNRRKPLEFEVGDRVMLKVSPWKGDIRFGKGVISTEYEGHLEILERIVLVAYRIENCLRKKSGVQRQRFIRVEPKEELVVMLPACAIGLINKGSLGVLVEVGYVRFLVDLSIVTPRQGGNARRKQEWISSQHMVSI
ncbi:hypothetical protein Tco_0952898 [Tanacetum coccineum]|uniref:Reverse transcriptase domain-containing protein n=1 Tax=Tanacetum coccineum TaxID=301880 RepID=A0ABQ5DYS9_9ASTR